MRGKRILVNGITLEGATLAPLLRNVRYWKGRGCTVAFLGNAALRKRIAETGIIDGFDFIELSGTGSLSGGIPFVLEGAKRNLSAMFCLRSLRDRYDIVYSRSSVLDLIVFPYFLKSIDTHIRWMSVFDNAVFFRGPGNVFIRLLSWIFFQISVMLLKKADAVFVISAGLKEYLWRRGIKNERMVVTGNGVEADLVRDALKRPGHTIDALYVGRINEKKGVFDLLNVLSMVKAQFPDFQLAIMGAGDPATVRKFREQARKHDLEKNVRVLGVMSGQEKFDVIKSSKTFWFLSYNESFGIALLEAVCCGVRSFAYDLKPYAEIYKNNEVSVFPVGDWKSVALKVIEVFEKGDFGNKNGESLLREYDWDKIAEIEYNTFLSGGRA